MAVKIIAALCTSLINIVVGFFFFGAMILSMNGYHENDASWGIGAFILLALIITAAMASGTFLMIGFMTRKQFHPLLAAVLSVFAFSIVSVGLMFISSILGVGIAELVRKF